MSDKKWYVVRAVSGQENKIKTYIENEIARLGLEDYVDQVDLCIPAAGMAGRVAQKRLWNLDKNIHSIDLGSVIDAITQRSTRTWIDRVGNRVDNLLMDK